MLVLHVFLVQLYACILYCPESPWEILDVSKLVLMAGAAEDEMCLDVLDHWEIGGKQR